MHACTRWIVMRGLKLYRLAAIIRLSIKFDMGGSGKDSRHYT